jgi:hypothetical protein
MRQKIDVAEVESATKIRAKYLRALENEEFGLLPGNTFVKTFLRTYGEYLGLDAQLLVEEYRAEHEPREQAEVQPFAPAANRRPRERRPRGPAGPPGPGTAVLVVVAVVLVIFAILGLTGGSGGKKSVSQTPPKKAPKTHTTTTPKPAPKPQPTTVRLRIVPVSATYLCIDRGRGTAVLYQGITSQPQRFTGKHLRINAGGTSLKLIVNKRPLKIQQSSQPIGYDFTPRRTRPLPSGLRPCQ